MNYQNEGKSAVRVFAENLPQIPDEIINGLLKVTKDEDGRVIINAYAVVLQKQFAAVSCLILENADSMSKEKSRVAEELLQVTCGADLLDQVKVLSENLGSGTSKIGLAGLIQMIKKVIKWLIKNVFKKIPLWLNEFIDLLDEILHELFGIGSPKLANILARKEQNYLAQLTKLAVLNREERYLFDSIEEEEA